MQRCREYIEALEEERRKIQVFQRELPLSLELVTQAIEACKQQMSGATVAECFQGQSECSEQTSSGGPVLEEFIPIKRALSSDEEEEESHKPKNNNGEDNKNNNNEKSLKKSEWLRSVQLWNQSPDPPIKEGSPKKVEVRKNGGAFHPFKKEKSTGAGPMTADGSPTSAPAAAASSTAETGGSSGGGGGGGGGGASKKEEKEGQSQRKSRRCWSPELHRRFLQALQQLGGSHVATPKQIRELMKVDGLTNDEVKSHLQKYRLHTRRPTPPIHNTADPQPPQFLVVGGIWVPPREYAALAAPPSLPGEAAASNIAATKGIYAPIAAPLPLLPQAAASQTQKEQHKQSNHSDVGDGGNHSEGGGVRSHSPSTSSSTHTTTASAAF
ncbi:hypothetical protein NMG60_11036054 [Bertholletia excelsa]